MYASVEEWLAYEGSHKSLADVDYNGEPDREVIELNLTRASAEMDGWLASRTSVPVTDKKAAAILKHHCTLIATYHLANTANTGTDDIETRYKASIAWLKSVAEGKSDLPLTASTAGSKSSGIGVTFVTSDRIFK